VVPVYDLLVRNNDLVVGTHGRAFWILDDLTALHQLTDEVRAAAVHLFQPRDTVRDWRLWGVYQGKSEEIKNYRMSLGMQTAFYEEKGSHGETVRRFLDVGENPPQGAIINYHLANTPAEDLALTILDQDGNTIKTYSSRVDAADGQALRLTAKPGLNRFIWDMRYPEAEKVPDDFSGETGNTGPMAAPGRYQLQLKVGDTVHTQSFNLILDPRINAAQADMQAQFELLLKIRDKVSETHRAVIRIRRIKQQVAGWADNLKESHPAIAEAGQTLLARLKGVEVELIQTEANRPGDRLRLKSRLNSKLMTLMSVVGVADFAPTKQSVEVFEHLSGRVDEQLAALQVLLADDVASFNHMVREAQIEAVVVH